VGVAPSSRKKSIVDIIWRDRQGEVEDEMRDLYLIGGGHGEPSAADRFPL
jgi:hypothetical protein